ncbi:MAG: Uma2 family endonuclease, partial [Gammaproteobacteria bacterium]|nr:Uma2 family endonuclease [Gammaproteobacteria bacterium]
MTGTVAPAGIAVETYPLPRRKIKPAFKKSAPEPEGVLNLPDSDGEPMENERERLQIHLCIESLYQHWAHRRDFFAAGNTFLYYSAAQAREVIKELKNPARPKRAFRGPDVYVVLNVDGSYRRNKWVVWEEGGRYPNVIFEFLSPTTRHKDLKEKKDLYEQTFRTHEYFCFDYLAPQKENSLLGWRLNKPGVYQPLTCNGQGRLWSESLKLWVGLWPGDILRDKTVWLRLYTPEGRLVLTPAEAEKQQSEIERQKAEAERQKAKAEHQQQI